MRKFLFSKRIPEIVHVYERFCQKNIPESFCFHENIPVNYENSHKSLLVTAELFLVHLSWSWKEIDLCKLKNLNKI